MDIVLISGFSGSGKSVALHVLEDRDHYCVDNLPVAMLPELVARLSGEGCARAAVAVDARSGEAIHLLPEKITALTAAGHRLTFLFLDAQDEVLLQRFSETRRRHPLAMENRTLAESIAEERRLLSPLFGLGCRIDTSRLRPAALRAWVASLADPAAERGMILVFQSFGFKHGVPLDADLLFDVRCLPNPYYEVALRPLTGLDKPVADWLEAEPEVARMRADIERFVESWLAAYLRENRAALTVAIGCTGGQHRSVYLARMLARAFQSGMGRGRVLERHRALAEHAGMA
jgi:UPF0042 nucleotide-binding protein